MLSNAYSLLGVYGAPMIETNLGNVHRLQIFVEVADQLNFSRAARRLLLTQPTVSRQVRELEEELGAELFHRGRIISLTETGEALYGYAKKILALAEDMEKTLRTAKGVVAGHVAFGASETLESRVAEAAITFRLAHQQVDTTIRFGSAQHIAEMVVDDRFAFGIVDHAPKDARLTVTTLAELDQKLAIVLPPGHPLAGRKSVEPRELERFPFIHYPRQHPGYIDDVLHEMGLNPRYAIEIESLYGIKEAVARGAGISILPMPTVHYEPSERMLLIPLARPTLHSAYYAVRSKFRHLTAAEQALYDHMQEVFATPIDLVTVHGSPGQTTLVVRPKGHSRPA